MPVFCVVFELGPFGKRDYAGISRGLESVGPACEVSHGTWLVKAEAESEVWAAIDPTATTHDSFVTFRLADRPEWSVRGGMDEIRSARVAEWLELHFPEG